MRSFSQKYFFSPGGVDQIMWFLPFLTDSPFLPTGKTSPRPHVYYGNTYGTGKSAPDGFINTAAEQILNGLRKRNINLGNGRSKRASAQKSKISGTGGANPVNRSSVEEKHENPSSFAI